MLITLPTAALHVIHSLNAAGWEAFAVGGCVRDSILGKKPYDWDIATSASPQELQSLFRAYRTVETGIQHGTLTVIIEDQPIEITTYRIDGCYTDGRHPDDVTFTNHLAEDLRRRDFTINAMAYHPTVGLIDPYGGQADLHAGVLRCVGDAHHRFTEDALRILRALRFASVLGLTIDTNTETAIHALASNLHLVSAERISTELLKLLCGESVSSVLSIYQDVLSEILSEKISVQDFTLLDNVPLTSTARLSALFYVADISKEDASATMQRLRLDGATAHNVIHLLAGRDREISSDDACLLRLLRDYGTDLIYTFYALKRVSSSIVNRTATLVADNTCYQLSMLAVNGNDLLALKYSPGPQIGQLLNRLLDAVIDGKCPNTKKELLEYSQKIKPVP